MSKYQIVLVIVGVVLIAFLYSLPKVIVKGKNQTVTAGKNPSPSSSVHSNADSVSNVSGEELVRLEGFKNSLATAASREDKIKFADSVSSVFRKNSKWDSAAFYKEMISELSPVEENLELAGDAYNQAANFSASPEKVTAMSEKARSFYRKVLDKKPDNLTVKSKLAMTYVSSENPMAGITLLREVVDKDPDNEMANFNLGILSIQSQQYDKAVQRFERIVELNPEQWKARFYLGVSYKELGKNKKAQEQFELVKKLEQDPEVLTIVDSYLEEIKSKK